VPDEIKKTAVYIDGYNHYYVRLRNTAYKWLDVVALFDMLIKVQDRPWSMANPDRVD